MRPLAVAVLLIGALTPAAAHAAEPVFGDKPGITCLGQLATIIGTEGPDDIRGTPGADVIHGLGGDDVIHGLDGNDIICGGPGRDRILGGFGWDRISAGTGPDVVWGGAGRDLIRGGGGADAINGGGNVDLVNAGHGVDLCLLSDRNRNCEITEIDPLAVDGMRDFTAPFAPDEFQCLADHMPTTGTTPAERPSITGVEAADARIRLIAERRGYRPRVQADTSTLVLADGWSMAPDAAEAWIAMRQSAARAGITMSVVSAYRSSATQRFLFMNKLNTQGQIRIGRPYTTGEIAGGAADAAIDAVLRLSSIPGYSRHHSGYTIDVGDGSGFSAFANTPAYRWLSADNYANARRFGFIPSYPDGAGPQGPEPEPWEFVWVGEGSRRQGGAPGFGRVDRVVVTDDEVRVRGWALDPLDETAPVEVSLHAGAHVTTIVADRVNMDVAMAYPRAGHLHGYAAIVARPPNDDVCVMSHGPVGAGSRVLGVVAQAT